MWLRGRLNKYLTSLTTIYQHPNIEERIIAFKQYADKALLVREELPPLQHPAYLHESTAKEILQFVKEQNIPNNIRILHALAHIEYNAFMSYADTFLRYRH